MGRGRPRPAAPGRLEPGRERAPRDAARRLRDGARRSPRRLVVSDTGPGLELDDLPHAFDRFFLYDKYGRERPVGSGLGLAIVKQLTEAMGGTVDGRVGARARARRSSSRCAAVAVPEPVPRPDNACSASYEVGDFAT